MSSCHVFAPELTAGHFCTRDVTTATGMHSSWAQFELSTKAHRLKALKALANLRYRHQLALLSACAPTSSISLTHTTRLGRTTSQGMEDPQCVHRQHTHQELRETPGAPAHSMHAHNAFSQEVVDALTHTK